MKGKGFADRVEMKEKEGGRVAFFAILSDDCAGGESANKPHNKKEDDTCSNIPPG